VGLLLATLPALPLSRIVACKSRGTKLIHVRSAHRETLDDVHARSTLCLRVPPQRRGAFVVTDARADAERGAGGHF
jgi:hypothetical protein